MRGTVSATFAVATEEIEAAIAVLAKAGFRSHPGHDSGTVVAGKHYGTDSPDGDIQHAHMEKAQSSLAAAGIDAVLRSSGVTIGGGTPEHRWLELYTSDLQPLLVEGEPLRILAATDEEASQELDALARQLGIDRDSITVRPAPQWSDYS